MVNACLEHQFIHNVQLNLKFSYDTKYEKVWQKLNTQNCDCFIRTLNNSLAFNIFRTCIIVFCLEMNLHRLTNEAQYILMI